MRPVGRRLGAALVILGASAALAGCGSGSGDADPVHRIAILRAVDASETEAALLPALAELGFPDERVEVLPGASSYPDPADAEAAVRRWVDDGAEVIVALATTSAQAAARATSEVPILFLVNDPRVVGLVEDERRPEANLTGSTYRVPADRVLSLADEAFGGIERVGCIHPVDDPGIAPVRQELERGTAALDLALHCEQYTGPGDAAAAAERLLAVGVDVVIPLNSPRTVEAFPQLEGALADAMVPVMSTTPWDAAALTLVPDGNAVYRQLAGQLARLLEGDAVSAIPVEDPAGYRVVVNLPAARRLGITVPPAIVAIADEVVR